MSFYDYQTFCLNTVGHSNLLNLGSASFKYATEGEIRRGTKYGIIQTFRYQQHIFHKTSLKLTQRLTEIGFQNA